MIGTIVNGRYEIVDFIKEDDRSVATAFVMGLICINRIDNPGVKQFLFTDEISVTYFSNLRYLGSHVHPVNILGLDRVRELRIARHEARIALQRWYSRIELLYGASSNGVQLSYNGLVGIFNDYLGGRFDSEKESETGSLPEHTYKKGTLVARKVDNHKYLYNDVIGKIVKVRKSGNTIYYSVDFIYDGTKEIAHENLFPLENFFDTYVNEFGYEALEDCLFFFNKGDKFINNGDYLYNKSNTVILQFEKYKKLFKELTPKK